MNSTISLIIDIASSCSSFFFGVLTSLTASLVITPGFTTAWGYNAITFLSRLLWWTAPRFLWRQKWKMNWSVQSENFSRDNSSPVKMSAIFSVIACEWTANSKSGHSFTYRMVGKISGTNKLSGRWFDKNNDDVGYFGTMQLVFSPLDRSAEGMWIGFSSDHSVKGGKIFISPLIPRSPLVGPDQVYSIGH